MLRCRPQKLALNCDGSRVSIIDINGVLSFYDMEVSTNDDGTASGEHLGFERKVRGLRVARPTLVLTSRLWQDAWDMVWAEDNPQLFAMMEKTRMYIMRGLDLEEPVLSSGYLCGFKDLHIKAVLLDEVMKSPEHADKEMVLDYETRSLRDARHILAKNGIEDAFSYIESNPHPVRVARG